MSQNLKINFTKIKKHSKDANADKNVLLLYLSKKSYLMI